jgi:hypothetical protein
MAEQVQVQEPAQVREPERVQALVPELEVAQVMVVQERVRVLETATAVVVHQVVVPAHNTKR